jgi:hypothetical protein
VRSAFERDLNSVRSARAWDLNSVRSAWAWDLNSANMAPKLLKVSSTGVPGVPREGAVVENDTAGASLGRGW